MQAAYDRGSDVIDPVTRDRDHALVDRHPMMPREVAGDMADHPAEQRIRRKAGRRQGDGEEIGLAVRCRDRLTPDIRGTGHADMQGRLGLGNDRKPRVARLALASRPVILLPRIEPLEDLEELSVALMSRMKVGTVGAADPAVIVGDRGIRCVRRIRHVPVVNKILDVVKIVRCICGNHGGFSRGKSAWPGYGRVLPRS